MQLLLGPAAAAVVGALIAVPVLLLLKFVYKVHAARRQLVSCPLPGPPLCNLTGHVPALLGPKGPWALLKWANEYGPLYKTQLLDDFCLVLTDPDTIARITRKTGPGPYLPKPHWNYEPMEIATRPKRVNILSSEDGPYHRAIRQAAAPCFSMSNLKQVVPLVVELTQRAVDHMSGHTSFDVTDAAKRITSDVMGQLLYGKDLRGTHWERSEYLEVLLPVLKAESALFNNPFHLWMLWDPEVRQQRRCIAKHDAIIGQEVRRMRKAPPEPHTIAAHVFSAIDPATGKLLDDAQVKAEIAIFMAAGYETTSHAITWCLTMLAAHPEVQDQVYAELQASGLAGDARRDFEASDLGRLQLLSAVIREALRLCTPVPFGGSRYVVDKEGAELCGFKAPKGTLVLMPLLAFGLAQHNYGPDTLEFKPQRWMTPATTTAAPAGPAGPAATPASTGGVLQAPDPLTFHSGGRDCIGQNLAKLELQVVLGMMLSRFRFSAGPELQRELDLAAATGQPVITAVHALAGDFITMQPLAGQLVLQLAPRS